MEQAAVLAEYAEYLRTGGTLAILALLLGFWLKKRKDDREGWGALITALQGQVDRQDTELKSGRELHRDCEKRLTEVEAQLRGVHRQLVMHSANAGLVLYPPSENVAEAAKRAKKIVEEGPPK